MCNRYSSIFIVVDITQLEFQAPKLDVGCGYDIVCDSIYIKKFEMDKDFFCNSVKGNDLAVLWVA